MGTASLAGIIGEGRARAAAATRRSGISYFPTFIDEQVARLQAAERLRTPLLYHGPVLIDGAEAASNAVFLVTITGFYPSGLAFGALFSEARAV
jgi:hypothetical protein